MADATIENLKRQVNSLQSALTELQQRFSRANVNGLDTIVTQSLFPYHEVHGPTRDSVDATHPMTFLVDFDEHVAALYKAEFKVKVARVRSNVSAAASGGGSSTTSAGGSAHTHTISQSLTSASGGGTTVTSAGGSSHTHGVSSTTAAASGAVTEVIDGGFTPPTATFGPSVVSTGLQSAQPPANHDHSLQGHTHKIYAGEPLFGTVYVSQSSHTHSISGQTAAAESTHTHSVTLGNHTHTISGSVTAASESSHTHGVTVPAHTHSMTYGIYEGPAPSAPQMTITINGVDRTAALGGPWDDTVALDLTPYLRDGAKIPLRQSNVIVITSDELIDMTVTCRALVTARLFDVGEG